MKKQKQRQIELPSDPRFVSRCHNAPVIWEKIIEDTSPHSSVIAIVGRCRACGGIQKILESADNINRIELAKSLHGNARWLLTTDEVKRLRSEPNMTHGKLVDAEIPKRIRVIVPVEPQPAPAQERDHTQSHDDSLEEDTFL